MAGLLVKNCGQLITHEPLVRSKRFASISYDDLGILDNAWLAVEDGLVLAYGQAEIPQNWQHFQTVDARGSLVTPGFIDCHTHPLYYGIRADEFAKKIAGASYQQIAEGGGGIKRSIRIARAASDLQLIDNCLVQFHRFLKHGVTTVEAKTGYGQSVEEELRHLRILKKCSNYTRQHIERTCLALHAMPDEVSDKPQFIRSMQECLLPQLATHQLADWIDMFVENGYFSVVEVEDFAKTAIALGLKMRLHADEFSDSGAAAAAARWGAASADHLQKANPEGIRAMAASGTVAVLLPTTSFFSKLDYASAQVFRSLQCPIAVGSDSNPGSSPLNNLGFAASLAALYCGLNAWEALVAVTWNAARALRLETKKGALAPGYDADFVIHSHSNIETWIADFGQALPREVRIGGQRVV